MTAPPPELTITQAVTEERTCCAVAMNEPPVAPPGTHTVDGAFSTRGPVIPIVTLNPGEGAGPVNPNEIVVDCPPTIDCGEAVIQAGSGGGGGGTTVTFAVAT
jgi:hypothetical protein